MLVSHCQHLEHEEGEPLGPSLVLRAAEERLAAILMTGSTTALALLPLVIGGNIPVHEIAYPLAVVIIGGLVTSTVLNLFLVPALYLKWARAGAPARGHGVVCSRRGRRYPHISDSSEARSAPQTSWRP